MKSTLLLWMYISQGAKGIIKNVASFVVFSLSAPMLQCSAILISLLFPFFSSNMSFFLFFSFNNFGETEWLSIPLSFALCVCVCVCEGDKVQNQSKCVQRLSSHQDCQDEMNNLLLTHTHTHFLSLTIQ